MHLLFTINENYVSVLETCIRSILRFPCEEGYDIYILHDQLSADQKQKLAKNAPETTNFHFVSVPDGAFSVFPQNARYPKTMYYRLLAAEFLPKTLNRILYLDPDIIVIRPLDELYHMSFDGNLFCGATHVRKFLTRLNGARLQMPEDAPYLNSGVLLINLEELRKRPCRQDILAYIEKRQAYFTLPDQDILSALYGNETKLIDHLRYNLSDRMFFLHNANPQNEKIDLDWVRKNTCIIHYCGKNKPWKENYRGVLDCFYHQVISSKN